MGCTAHLCLLAKKRTIMTSLTSEEGATMLDPTEYDPNSKDLTDDPNFLGDNDHGDTIPAPKCGVCGVPWADHMGIMGVCLNNKALKEDFKDSLEAHDEMRLEIARLIKERDEARRMYCEERSCPTRKYYGPLVSKHSIAGNNMWDCFKEETP